MKYIWDDQLHLYRAKNPEEFSYSDGAEVEERLLGIVSKATDRGTFSQELAQQICDWPTEYHLSRSRHCLVRPLQLRAGDKVLELGCGCGAITRYLGEIGANVVAVEGSLARARVAAERSRELANVRVVVDDILSFETDERFGCILLIGVLEYAALFSGSEKPFEHYLQAVSRFLAPGGRVVIAIENKVGLKYFNGCGEDHVDVPFFGVQDLYNTKTARTFGRRELITLLSAAGLSGFRFYYPFPDYKLPSVVLSENALTDTGFDAIDLLARCHARDYTGSPYRGFDEALAFSVLHTNGLLADLSNSFFVVATPHPEPQTRPAELAFAWSVNRAAELCTQTTFVRDAAGIRVLKELLASSASGSRTVDKGLTITHDVSESVYRPGRQLSWNLLRARAARGDVKSIVQALRPWMKFLLDHAQVPPATVADISEETPQLSSYVLAGNFLDCTPFNLLNVDGDLVPIDVEWRSENDISLGWVITRGVLWSMPPGMSSGNFAPSILELIEALCDGFELRVSELDVEIWLNQEAEFQERVIGHACETLTTSRTFRGLRSFVGEISTLKHKLDHREEQVVSLEHTVASLNYAVAAREVDVTNLRAVLAERDTSLAQVISERGRLLDEVSQLGARNSSLGVELTQRSEQLNSVLQSRAWKLTAPLRAVAKLRPRSSREALQIKQDSQLIAQSGLFDVDWYLSQNPEVAAHGADAVTHYLQHGALEGRDPCPSFSSKWYLEQNPDVQAAGVNPLVHYLRFGAAEGRRPAAIGNGIEDGGQLISASVGNGAEPYDVFGYMSYPIDTSALPKRVAIGVSSLGNFFMSEIAYMMEEAFRRLGVKTRLFAEHEASALPDYEAVVIIAPHEFFLLGDGPIALEALRRVPTLVMFNVEQRQTQWFRVAEQYLRHASVVLDINYQSARHLARSGYKSLFFPLGYSEYIESTFDGCKLPEQKIFIPAAVRSSLPLSYAARPIDILFIGASSARRQEFFARNASYFADKNCFIYLPDTDRPFLAAEPRTIDFASFVSLVKRSKVLLNVHRDEDPFLEWQRIVTLGIMQRTLVVTDHCEPGPCVQANLDYLDGPLATLPELCDFALHNPQAAEFIADRAYAKLRDQYPMEQVLAKCWMALAKISS